MIHRTFAIPLRDTTTGFDPRYKLSDVGLNPSDFHSFSYIDLFGLQYPNEETITELTSSADRTYISMFVTDNPPEPAYRYRVELTSTVELNSDLVLKFVSLPDVQEVDTTLYHLSYLLKQALKVDTPIDTILEAIKTGN